MNFFVLARPDVFSDLVSSETITWITLAALGVFLLYIFLKMYKLIEV